MKKVLLLLYIGLSFSGFSQTNFRFADSTAQWNEVRIESGWNSPQGTTTTIIFKGNTDTLIHGKKYQNIRTDSGSVFLRRDSINRVYEFYEPDTNEGLLYDFGKQAGDTILQLGIPGGYQPCVVDSVDSVFLGHLRKRMYVNYYDHGYTDVWIDGIGTLHDYIFLPRGIIFIEPDETHLLCFFENNQLHYHYTVFDTCYVQINVGVDEIRIPNSAFRIAPNPASTYLTIQSNQNISSPAVFQLYDITGRMILQKPLTAPTTRIELSDVSKGMYLYNVVSEKEKVGAGKLIIE